jgi:hypothetical protein
MLLLHAAARIHEGQHGVPPRYLAVSFPAFGELRSTTDIDARLGPYGIESAFVQAGRVIATARTDFRQQCDEAVEAD